MEVRRRRTRSAYSPITALLFCACLVLFSISALFSSICNNNASAGRGTPRTVSFLERKAAKRELGWVGGGPGSYPPRCTSKCGDCTPCYPVHVPVPPGTPVINEYYPEAWRCKCGNTLYMP